MKWQLWIQRTQYYDHPQDRLQFGYSQYVTQRELMRLFEGDIKTNFLNSTYCLIYKEHFDTKMILISYSYQKL